MIPLGRRRYRERRLYPTNPLLSGWFRISCFQVAVASTKTHILLILATLFSGFLAGANIDRAFVAMPAWQDVSATAWAEFSRHGDLGNGLILYPIEAVGGALLTLATAMRARTILRTQPARRSNLSAFGVKQT
jgi:ABC-type antimicrobial peptide transport system permease subunit